MTDNKIDNAGRTAPDETGTDEMDAKCAQFAVPPNVIADAYHEICNSLSVLLPRLKLLGKHFAQIGELLETLRGLDLDSPPEEIKERVLACLKFDGRGRGLRFYVAKLSSGFGPCIRELEAIKVATDKLKITRGARISTAAAVDPREVLEHILDFLEHDLKADGIAVSLRAEGPPLKVSCPDTEISMVFKNLLLNAAEAIREKMSKGWHKMAAEGYKPALDIRIDSGDGFAEIRVRDNGIGMSEEVKKRIFERFFTTKPVTKGTGVGLSVAKETIDRCGGSLDVESEEGEWTEFLVTLPLSENDHVE